MPLLEIEDLHIHYGHVHALKGISLSVGEGEIITLLGANGAGKSTTLRAVSGLLKPSQGDIRYQGKSLAKIQAHDITALGIAHCPEGRKVFTTLTVDENLNLGAYTRTDGKAAIDASRVEVFSLFPRLLERRQQLAGTLSGGEQQMLATARALMTRPKLLLLDEPSLGLSPLLVQQILRTIREISRQGVTILLVEQNARAALSLADRGYVLESGQVVLSGTASELQQSERVRHAYLGEQAG